MPVLFAFREDRFGFRFEIGERAVLGRSPECDLILFDRATSRQHAEILATEDGYVLRDMGSTNGTLHNEVRVPGQVPLRPNDEIRVGQEIFLFDPKLDVAVGPEGAVLIVGEVENKPEGLVTSAAEADMSALERNCLAPLAQVAAALAERPNKNRVLKQAAYAVTKIFGATSLVLLWPETRETERLTALLARPLDHRLHLSSSMVNLAIGESQALIWPTAINTLDFVKGERLLEVIPYSAMAVPLKAHGERQGLLYVGSDHRHYGTQDLNFFVALAGLISSALINSTLIGQLDYRVAREEEALERGSDFVGQNPQTKALLGTASQISQTDTRLLLNGEVGTGKEVLARRIHFQSHRRRGPFVSINCSAYASGLLERALFGVDGSEHEEETPGLLEQADGGTLFIRHVDHLSLTAQFELLRAIEEGVMYRLGSSIPRPINFRTIASTTNDLWAMVKAGEFREDLCQRLSEMVLTLPPLREVRDDIGGLARHFLSMAARQMGVPMPEMDPAAEDCLRSYPWPGNVSELKNMMDRLVIFAAGERIVLDDLSPDIRYAPGAFRSYNGEPESDTMAEVERILIRRALARSNGDYSIAADILSISESDLEECIHRYEITLD